MVQESTNLTSDILAGMYGKAGNSYTYKVLMDVSLKGESGACMSYDITSTVDRIQAFF
jgi:hypothetical protein